MSSHVQFPHLGIRMKLSSLPSTEGVDYQSTCETISAFRSQEEAYRCRNYVRRRRQLHKFVASLNDGSELDQLIDPACREKMCDWCYRVCDCEHFSFNRDIVAVAFSYLDRFLDRFICDRQTFKLATVTAFYVAAKIMATTHMSIETLVDLSRGEFGKDDIEHMEAAILEKLEWRMNPPIVQTFVRQLQLLHVESSSPAISAELYRRSIYFAELSVYDYCFVTKDRYTVAVACMLNAIQAIDDNNIDLLSIDREALKSQRSALRRELDFKFLEKVQSRLWYLYSCSPHSADSCVMPLDHSRNHDKTSDMYPTQKEKSNVPSHSPVSVHL